MLSSTHNYIDMLNKSSTDGFDQKEIERLSNLISAIHQHHNISLSRIEEDGRIANKYVALAANFNFLQFVISYLQQHGKIREYRQLTKIIYNLPRPTYIKDNTIGSFLYGCNQSDYGDVNERCALNCINSFNPRWKKVRCDKQIWTISSDRRRFSSRINGNRLKLIHSADFPQDAIDPSIKDRSKSTINPSPLALIYVEGDFDGFRKEEIRALENHHVQYVSIYIKENNRYLQLLPSTHVEMLPRQIENKSSKTENPPIENESVSPPYDESVNYDIAEQELNNLSTASIKTSNIIIVILVIIILLALLLYFFFNSRSSNNSNIADNFPIYWGTSQNMSYSQLELNNHSHECFFYYHCGSKFPFIIYQKLLSFTLTVHAYLIL